jgi:CO/xanthine dehydrogenase FAD-binding subunit
VTADEAGDCAEARIALLGAGPVPVRATEAERVVRGRRIDEEAAREAGERAAAAADPPGDRAHRRALLRTLVRTALLRAVERG